MLHQGHPAATKGHPAVPRSPNRTNPCHSTQASDLGSSYLCTGLAVVGQEPHVPPCHVVSLAQDGWCHAQVERRSCQLWVLPGPGSADCLALHWEPVHPTHCSRSQWDGRRHQGAEAQEGRTEPLGSPSLTPCLGEPSPAALAQVKSLLSLPTASVWHPLHFLWDSHWIPCNRNLQEGGLLPQE